MPLLKQLFRNKKVLIGVTIVALVILLRITSYNVCYTKLFRRED